MTELAAGAVDTLRAQMTGGVFLPGDGGYWNACSIWNGAVGRRPSVVASCAASSDVAVALRFAGQQGLEVSVRGGGHNYAGHALCQGGLMIDLTPMKSVTVDAAARRAACGGGTTWAGLDAARVPLENRIRLVTCRSSVRQAARVYSLIKP